MLIHDLFMVPGTFVLEARHASTRSGSNHWLPARKKVILAMLSLKEATEATMEKIDAMIRRSSYQGAAIYIVNFVVLFKLRLIIVKVYLTMCIQ